jgi:hypothetical protein
MTTSMVVSQLDPCVNCEIFAVAIKGVSMKTEEFTALKTVAKRQPVKI